MKKIIAASIIALISMASAAHAADDYCFQFAEQHYGIDRRILFGISAAESKSNNATVHYNEGTKTVDLGHMQINSWWGFTEEELADPCFQTIAAAAIITDCMKRYSGIDVIICYNTGKSYDEVSPDNKEPVRKYVDRVLDNIERAAEPKQTLVAANEH